MSPSSQANRTVVQRFFDPQPGDAIDDAGAVAGELLNAPPDQVLKAAGVRARRGESARSAAKRHLASLLKRRHTK